MSDSGAHRHALLGTPWLLPPSSPLLACPPPSSELDCRNKEPILAALKDFLGSAVPRGLFLEVASGTGQASRRLDAVFRKATTVASCLHLGTGMRSNTDGALGACRLPVCKFANPRTMSTPTGAFQPSAPSQLLCRVPDSGVCCTLPFGLCSTWRTLRRACRS